MCDLGVFLFPRGLGTRILNSEIFRGLAKYRVKYVENYENAPHRGNLDVCEIKPRDIAWFWVENHLKPLFGYRKFAKNITFNNRIIAGNKPLVTAIIFKALKLWDAML